ncbi:LamG-like jellyroll fold domain-containing protein [Streptomyces sp. MB09-02B]|uniref:LamG-like jellyroll fold domain-containing protein n=1 Tax=Streptomyces sp. MB09-02B TaxID=3028667 RepID=UPI0029A754E5|nr:LamG-like jellyroll fold domain-containing protein [Streptomyces sp. MB09-02B]MDX3643484.1 DNRLRE domain-containing protein [Streptomyces sp. MB09-02B]
MTNPWFRRLRAARTLGMLLGSAVVLGTLPAVTSPAGAAGSTTPASGEAAAFALAAETGEPVEIIQQRTEDELVFANPDGSLTSETSVQPQRVERPDGSWVKADATLERRPDGTVGPKAAVVDLAFAAAGSSDFVTLGEEGKSFTLSWPTPLPEPVLDGDTAEYREVLPGVDLLASASVTGYSYVLEVKTPEAARSSELAALRLPVRAEGLDLSTGATGGLQAVDASGERVFGGQAPKMWDSADSGDEVPADAVPASGAQTLPQEAPDAAAKVADMALDVSPSAVTVEPDRALLTADDTDFPVYIDPEAGMSKSEWLYVSSANPSTEFHKFKKDEGVGRCSADTIGGIYYVCSGSPYTNRMYFQFSTDGWKNRTISKAVFEVYETFSFSCTKSTVNLHMVAEGGVDSATNWNNKPKDGDLMVDRSVAYGRGDSCSPDAPASWVDFEDSANESNENLTSSVRKKAAGEDPIAFSLRAADEGDPNSWKRFRGDNAKLVVTYNTRPNKPTGEKLSNPEEKTCTTDNTKRPWIRDATPAMSVSGTDADSHTDGSGQNLTATFRVWDQVDGRPMVYEGKDGPQNEGRFERGIPVKELAHGHGYKWHAQTYDGSTGKLKDSGYSEWSDWCEFVVDVKAPTTEPHVEPVASEADLPVGAKRHFTLSANGNADPVFKNDVEFYEWDLGNDTPARKADPAALGGNATIEVPTSTFGPNVLYVRSVDRAGNRGPLEKYFFTVDRACADILANTCAAAVYGLDQTSGATAPDTSGHDRDLTVKGADWVAGNNSASDPADKALRFNGTTDHATAVSAVHTGQAFTVSAWVRPTSLSKNISVVSQAGNQGNGLNLYYSTAYKRWIFGRHISDTADSDIVRAMAASERPATVNKWVHLAGTYDPVTRKFTLFVDGEEQGSATVTDVWNATKGLNIGRAQYGADWSDPFAGDIDDVRLVPGLLSGTEIFRLANN